MAMDSAALPAGILDGATLNHVAIVVRSLDGARERLTGLGLASWTGVWEAEIPANNRGSDVTIGVRAQFAGMGAPVMLEIVEPTNDFSMFATFLRERGEGVQHFGYRFEDLDERLERAKEAGIEIDWLVRDAHGVAVAFLSPDASHGVSLELVRNTPPVDVQPWTRDG